VLIRISTPKAAPTLGRVLVAGLAMAAFVLAFPALSQTINTVAGNGSATFAGDGGAATSASLFFPFGVALDATGNLYIADEGNHRVRKVAAVTGIITTVAGNGSATFAGDGGAATSASLDPFAVALDESGNLYIADVGNHRIRKVAATTGIVTTVAGDGSATFAGDGGAATSASLNSPYGVALDASGNLYIADLNNYRIRKVDAASGIITTVAGNGIPTYAGDGGAATSASLNSPTGVALDASGNLYVADYYNQRIRKVDVASGIITTVAGNGSPTFAGDGEAATSASLNGPLGVALDANGSLYIADIGNNRIRKVAATTRIVTTVAGNGRATFAGDGGAATSASLNGPFGVALDASGNLYIADLNNYRIRKVIFHVARADFFGTGRSDILWRDASTGENYLYPMDGTTILAGEGYLRTVADPNWTVAGIGDFDGDGKADILWRNTSTGQNYIYFMDGSTIKPSEGFTQTVPDQNWQVAGIGDFDGDGKDDILWRNSVTGENYLYPMNGLSIKPTEGFLRTVADTSWQIVGVGDFDGDGKADILWRNSISGQNYLYPMDGKAIKPTEGFLRTVADASWQVKGVGDFDGDGKADIAWRNSSSGENYLYPMDGTVIKPTEGSLRTVADLNWQIVAVGDYDGDGKSDLLWRNSSTGENYLYPMDGTTIKLNEGLLRTVPVGNWTVIAN
jgi:streptogramin lyase